MLILRIRNDDGKDQGYAQEPLPGAVSIVLDKHDVVGIYNAFPYRIVIASRTDGGILLVPSLADRLRKVGPVKLEFYFE